MTYRVLCDGEDHAEWLRRRDEGVGASESSSILGIGYGSAWSVHAQKLGLRQVAETEAMADGRDWEEITGRRLLADPEFLGRFGRCCRLLRNKKLLQSVEWPWMLATPDGWIETADGVAILVEFKATGRPEAWADGVPAYHVCQVQHQMAVVGEQRGLIAVKSFGRPVQWSLIERDEEYIARIVEACRVFMDRVRAKEPPPLCAIDGSESTGEAIRALYPHETDEVRVLPTDLVAIVDEWQAQSEAEAEHKECKDRLGQQIRAAIGSAQSGVLADGRVLTLRTQAGSTYTVTRQPTRVLRLQKGKA